MNGLPYYKAYPRDFIEGTIGMDFELKAAYRLVLDLIYMQGGNLVDDARYISGLLGCSVKKWNGLRSALISSNKIVVRNGYLGNYRADKELETFGKFQDKQRENRSRPNKNKDLKSPPFHPSDTDTDTDNSYATSAGARDVTARMSELYSALGITDETKLPGLLTYSEPIQWVNAGCDVDADILPALRSIAARGRPVRSWAYCSNAVFEARDRRIAPAPIPNARPNSNSPPKPKTIGEMFREDAIRQGIIPNGTPDNKSAECLGTGDGSAEGGGSGVTRYFALTGHELGSF